MPENVKENVVNSFNLTMDDEILFFRDISLRLSGDQGLLMTTSNVYWKLDGNEESNTFYYLDWSQIMSAEYQDMKMYLFGYNGAPFDPPLDISLFFAGEFQIDHAQYFASVLSEIAYLCQPDETPDEAKERIEELMNAQNYSEAEEACNAYQEIHGYDPWVGLQKATIAIQQGDLDKGSDEAVEVYETVGEQSKGSPLPPIVGDACAIISYIGLQKQDYENSRFFAFEAIGNSDPSQQDFRIERFEEINELYSRYFLELDISHRRLLVPVKEIINLASMEIAVLEMPLIGEAIHFPDGHPIPNKLYVAHPHSSDRYVPFDDYELELLEDKLREFYWVAQCLGATDISIEGANRTLNPRLKQLKRRFPLNQQFAAIQIPFIPDDLLWFEHEPSWKRMATQRLQGGLLEHVEQMESQNIGGVTAALPDLAEIRIDFIILSIGVEGDLSPEAEKAFKQKDNLSLRIHVKFAPVSVQYMANANEVISLPQQSDSSKTTAEQEYLTAYKECLASNGGEFSDSERRLLERMRKSLGISVKRAAELEDSLTPALQLTEAESEYLEEYKLCAAEGSITDSERRLLNRMRKTLGISDERAIEIESSINY